MSFLKSNKSILFIALGALVVLIAAYSNHFNNGFHFDDTHTITNNQYIRDIGNIPLFFTELETFGTMPNNRAYRPVVTTLNSIDYWMGDSLNTFYFHLSIFFWYVIQAILMFMFFKNTFDLEFKENRNKYIALFSVLFYVFHTANAETVNYIIMRSDSFSTLCIIASFVLYQNEKARKRYLYLITMLVGIATKETGLMFVPLLALYIFLFVEKASMADLFLLKNIKAIKNTLIKVFPALIVGVLFFTFSRTYFKADEGLFFIEHPSSPFYYFVTQWYIIAHYLANFILPLNLSADPDYTIIYTIFDQRVLLGLFVILSLVVIAFVTSKKNKPIAFGILWFFIALAPTSSFKPFGQIANDHRTFFPYIGLVLSLGWYIFGLLKKYKEQIQNSKVLTFGIPALYIIILLLHANGIFQRNKVWHNSESLWEDVAQKSPNNARGLMNYGLSQMNQGKYDITLDLFERAMKITPYYSYLHINMAILKNAMGFPEEAESYFKSALKYDPTNVETHFYYARWLINNKREKEGKELLIKGNKLSPGHTSTIALLDQLNHVEGQSNAGLSTDELMRRVNENPNADNYLSLSIAYYQAGEYQQCIEACYKALELNPNYAEAYNNICSAHILLKEYEKATKACNKALEIKPDFQLAKNNLIWVKSLKDSQ